MTCPSEVTIAGVPVVKAVTGKRKTEVWIADPRWALAILEEAGLADDKLRKFVAREGWKP